jgi:hypothetical protein
MPWLQTLAPVSQSAGVAAPSTDSNRGPVTAACYSAGGRLACTSDILVLIAKTVGSGVGRLSLSASAGTRLPQSSR